MPRIECVHQARYPLENVFHAAFASIVEQALPRLLLEFVGECAEERIQLWYAGRCEVVDRAAGTSGGAELRAANGTHRALVGFRHGVAGLMTSEAGAVHGKILAACRAGDVQRALCGSGGGLLLARPGVLIDIL